MRSDYFFPFDKRNDIKNCNYAYNTERKFNQAPDATDRLPISQLNGPQLSHAD